MLKKSVHPNVPHLHCVICTSRSNACTTGMKIHVIHKPVNCS